MSLRTLMRHWVVIQRNDKTSQTDEGFIDYQGAWLTVAQIRCNLQEVNKRKAFMGQLSKVEDLSTHVIYYIRTDVYNIIQESPAFRAVVWRNNFSQKIDEQLLKDNGNKDSFNIYQIKSNTNLTEGQKGTRKRVYLLNCEKTSKMDL